MGGKQLSSGHRQGMEKVRLLFDMQIPEHGNAAQYRQSGQHKHAQLPFIQQPMDQRPYRIPLLRITQIHILQLFLNAQDHTHRHRNQLQQQGQGKQCRISSAALPHQCTGLTG